MKRRNFLKGLLGAVATGTILSKLESEAVEPTQWQIDASGHLGNRIDNTYDFGASGANRPRNIYVEPYQLSYELIREQLEFVIDSYL